MRRADRTTTRWPWALVCVIGVHLLTTAGTWWITDHGEILVVADRFLTSGRLDLRDLRPAFADWTRITATRSNPETRFLPGSVLSLVPFLAIDRLLGWTEPKQFRFVHLQGHFFVGASLLLAGLAVFRSTRSQPLAALAVFLAGLSWPVWMIARRLGPEPVLLFLVTLFITGGVRIRSLCLFALPWVHASGLILGVGLVSLFAFEEAKASAWVIPLLALAGGVASVARLWNLPVHGNLIYGGYGAFAGDRFFQLRNPIAGITLQFLTIVVSTLSLWIFGVSRSRLGLGRCLVVALPALLFFGTFSNTEVARRFAPFVAGWVILLMQRAAPLSFAFAMSLAALALGSGVFGLSMDFVSSVPTPWGSFNGPHLLLVSLAFVEHRETIAAVLAAVLLASTMVGAQRALRTMRGEDPVLQ